jgi:hypothetical protein
MFRGKTVDNVRPPCTFTIDMMAALVESLGRRYNMRMIRLIGPAVLVVAVWLGWQATESVYPQDNPRLATLDIAIWPEFYRPAALVILRA